MPDGTFVKEVAALVRQRPELFDVYGKKILVAGNEVHIDEDPHPLLPTPEALECSTLTGVADYFQSGIPQADLTDTFDALIVQVVSPSEVLVLSPVVGAHRQQFVYLVAQPSLAGLTLGRYMEMLSFHIELATRYVDTPERQALQAFCGPLRAGKMLKLEDDGVSQNVTTTAGVTRGSEAVAAKQLWTLAPFRTFPEISQPESPFLLRLDQADDDGTPVPKAMLMEADGGAWRAEAIRRIGEWLRAKLGDEVTVIA